LIGAAALAFATSVIPVAAQAAPFTTTTLHSRRVPAAAQNRRPVNNRPRYVAPRRYYHSTGRNYYNNNDTVVVATPYGWQVLNYPTYYYPNGMPYYGPYSGWNSPPTGAPIAPGPPLNLSPLGPVPKQSLLGPIPKGGAMGSAPTGTIFRR